VNHKRMMEWANKWARTHTVKKEPRSKTGPGRYEADQNWQAISTSRVINCRHLAICQSHTFPCNRQALPSTFSASPCQ
jgi:hypothetical protein